MNWFFFYLVCPERVQCIQKLLLHRVGVTKHRSVIYATFLSPRMLHWLFVSTTCVVERSCTDTHRRDMGWICGSNSNCFSIPALNGECFPNNSAFRLSKNLMAVWTDNKAITVFVWFCSRLFIFDSIHTSPMKYKSTSLHISVIKFEILISWRNLLTNMLLWLRIIFMPIENNYRLLLTVCTVWTSCVCRILA